MKKRIILAALAIASALMVSVPADAAKKNKDVVKRERGTNLRILDCNVWNYTKDTIPQAWKDLGADCRSQARCHGFSKVLHSYVPDLFGFQEYTSLMCECLEPLIEDLGYETVIKKTEDGLWNWTPIYYNPEVLELVESNYFMYNPQYSDKNSKSYTVAVFRHKQTSKLFISLCTHLWWKGEKAMPGSNAVREKQVRQIIEAVTALRAKYNCPIIVMGDMNCNLKSDALKQFLQVGFVPAWKLATVYGDTSHGHHICDKDGFSTEIRSKYAKNDGTTCIDHMMLFGLEKGSEVLVFSRITDAYTVPLTDHYPNYMDMKL